MTAIAIIPAKGRSQRLPGKNVKPFMGKPMIAYAIETARQCSLFQSVWVSTESEDVAAVAKDYHAGWIKRPPELAEINAPDCGPEEIIRHGIRALRGLGHAPDFICCIYPCTPLMLPEDLERGFLELVDNPKAPYAYAASLMPLRPKDLRWDAGQWYWGRRESWLMGMPLDSEGTLKVVIPKTRICDINSPEDWKRAEEMYGVTA